MKKRFDTETFSGMCDGITVTKELKRKERRRGGALLAAAIKNTSEKKREKFFRATFFTVGCRAIDIYLHQN